MRPPNGRMPSDVCPGLGQGGGNCRPSSALSPAACLLWRGPPMVSRMLAPQGLGGPLTPLWNLEAAPGSRSLGVGRLCPGPFLATLPPEALLQQPPCGFPGSFAQPSPAPPTLSAHSALEGDHSAERTGPLAQPEWPGAPALSLMESVLP